jgi:hypothetical protein
MSLPFFTVRKTEENQIHVECEGSGSELMNLFANVMNDNNDIKEVIVMALMALEMRASEEEGPSDDAIAAVLSENPPVAEA